MRPPPKLTHSSELTAQPDADIGALIGGRYRVIAPIGEGGMARVYEVEHVELGRHFALKLLHPHFANESAQVERFQQEARAIARLESPHIVGMVDCGVTERGTPFFVMELLRGSVLRHIVRRDGPLSASRAAHLALDASRGLAVAHAAGIVHRDLKPENLFVTRDADGKEHCKLLDFGVAKLAEGNLTLPGALLGTARYMAPEQLNSDLPVGPAADLFALGVTLFECLTGKPPFDADTFERLLFKTMNQPTPDLLGVRPNLPPALASLVTRLLAKEPGKRPRSAQAVAAELTRFLSPGAHPELGMTNTTIATKPSAPTSTIREPSALKGPLIVVGALALVTLVALSWALTRQASPPIGPAPRSAEPVARSAELSAPVAVPPAATSDASPSIAPSAVPSSRYRKRVAASAPTASAREAPPASSDLPLFFPRRAN